jgi:hypothetical protein
MNPEFVNERSAVHVIQYEKARKELNAVAATQSLTQVQRSMSMRK